MQDNCVLESIKLSIVEWSLYMYKKEAMDERPVHTFKTMHFMHLKIQNLVAKLALCKKNASLPRIYTSRLIFFLRVHTLIST